MTDEITPTWQPERPIEIVAGTPPGGGLDRVARALARVLVSEQLLRVPVSVVNIPGDGARRAWKALDARVGDPHVLCVSSPNLTSDHLLGLATFSHENYTPLAILVTEYIAFVVRSASELGTAEALLQRLGRGKPSISVALSTALGNPNHVALACVTRQAGGDSRKLQTRVFDTALDAVADVIAGNAELGAVTSASVVKDFERGSARVLAVSAPARLPGIFAEVPTWSELSVPCLVGAWRGLSGPRALLPAHIAFWQQTLAAVAQTEAWRAELEQHSWTAHHLDDAALIGYLERERVETAELLRELGLIGPNGALAN